MSRTGMKFTLSDFPAKGNELTAEEIVAIAQQAERRGFDRIGITDFPFHFDCIAMMTGCLRGTTSIAVESLVTTPYARLPDVAACAWATMAELSGGRAILGIGGGVEAPSQVWVPPWGNRRPHPVQAVREMVAICRDMWEGREPSVDGEVLRSSGMKLDFPLRSRVPVLIAARGPLMLALAGELADIVHIGAPFLGRRYIDRAIGRVMTGAERGGRRQGDFEVDLTVSLSASSNAEKARRFAKMTTGAAILWMAGADEYARKRPWDRPEEFDVPEEVVEALAEDWDMWSGEPLPGSVERLLTDDILSRFSVAGDPESCAEQLVGLAREFPQVTGFRFKLPPLTGPESHDDFVEIVEGAGQVIQEFNALIERAEGGEKGVEHG